jgi:hypothetical protein
MTVTQIRKTRTPSATTAAAEAPAPGAWAHALDDLDVADALLTTIHHRLDAADEEWGAEHTTMDFALSHLHRAMEKVRELRDAATAAPSAPLE